MFLSTFPIYPVKEYRDTATAAGASLAQDQGLIEWRPSMELEEDSDVPVRLVSAWQATEELVELLRHAFVDFIGLA